MVPSLRCSCIDEIPLERKTTQQPLGSQLWKYIPFYRMFSSRHPIKHVVLKNVGTGIDEVREHLIRSRFFFEFRDVVLLVQTHDAETCRVLDFPQS